MSHPALIHSIDLNTCKASDTNFDLEFTLTSVKGGFVNSFVLYFKVSAFQKGKPQSKEVKMDFEMRFSYNYIDFHK